MIHTIKCIDCGIEFDCVCEDYDAESNSCSESDSCARCRERIHGEVTPLDRLTFQRAVTETDNAERKVGT